MKLVRLHLRDFQSHQDRELSCAPGITTIMGPTDVGKSAILRALRWVCLNDFTGDDFVRQGARRAEVELEVAAGDRTWTIRRTKGSGQNTYHLEDREFRAFGSGVPPDIEKLLSVGPLNFQDQHDPPFWFHETAGEVSRRLNAIVDLSLMDEALGYVGGQIRRFQEKKEWHQDRVKQLETSLQPYADLDQRLKDFQQVQGLLSQWERLSRRTGRLGELVHQANRITTEGQPYRRRFKEGTELLSRTEAWRAQAERTRRLRALIRDLTERQRQLQSPPPRMDQIEVPYRQWKAASERYERLWALQSRSVLAKDTLSQAQRRLEEAEKAFHAVRGQPCPVCGRPLP